MIQLLELQVTPTAETEVECSTGQVEPAAGTDTSEWENNRVVVQSVQVILTLRVQDYLPMGQCVQFFFL